MTPTGTRTWSNVLAPRLHARQEQLHVSLVSRLRYESYVEAQFVAHRSIHACLDSIATLWERFHTEDHSDGWLMREKAMQLHLKESEPLENVPRRATTLALAHGRQELTSYVEKTQPTILCPHTQKMMLFPQRIGCGFRRVHERLSHYLTDIYQVFVTSMHREMT